MPTLNFKKKVADKVERWEILQTIRENVDGIELFDPLYLYTGLKTNQCRALSRNAKGDNGKGLAICVYLERVEITRKSIIVGTTTINDRDEMAKFALANGFESLDKFFDFYLTGMRYHNKSLKKRKYVGCLIKWIPWYYSHDLFNQMFSNSYVKVLYAAKIASNQSDFVEQYVQHKTEGDRLNKCANNIVSVNSFSLVGVDISKYKDNYYWKFSTDSNQGLWKGIPSYLYKALIQFKTETDQTTPHKDVQPLLTTGE